VIPLPACEAFIVRPVYTHDPPVAMQSCSTSRWRIRARESVLKGSKKRLSSGSAISRPSSSSTTAAIAS
jgi:hypothetical protein